MRFGDKQVPLTLRRDDPLNAAAALIEIEAVTSLTTSLLQRSVTSAAFL